MVLNNELCFPGVNRNGHRFALLIRHGHFDLRHISGVSHKSRRKQRSHAQLQCVTAEVNGHDETIPLKYVVTKQEFASYLLRGARRCRPCAWWQSKCHQRRDEINKPDGDFADARCFLIAKNPFHQRAKQRVS
ncbi:Uncharacterised protein [Shigella sonnei]|nr:Uncharacterised protein [Shigella sonnei]CSG39939.1 Uncharacterised protein [Shigella sonnei]CSH94117.1 Uncharacterised protein [Shigella sonnei]CSS53437.1 Uncharacterised protein [Shigella sonnei]